MRNSVTQYDGFMLRRYSKTGHCGTFEHFRDIETSNHVTGWLYCLCIFRRSWQTPPSCFGQFSSVKLTDFTDRKVYLALTSGEMLDFTDRKFYLALMSGKMDSFADGCKTTGILCWASLYIYYHAKFRSIIRIPKKYADNFKNSPWAIWKHVFML